MEHIEVITSAQRLKHYTGQEKAQFVPMTMQSRSSVALVDRQYSR